MHIQKVTSGIPLAAGFRGSFLLKHNATYASSSRSVDGFSVSKSISISSGLESLRLGSRDWIIVTTWPNLSPIDSNKTTTSHNSHNRSLQSTNKPVWNV